MSVILSIITGSAFIGYFFGLEWSAISAVVWAMVYSKDITSELRGN